MHTLTATVAENNQITVETDTYWSCKAEGNFLLSKYSGNGTDVIDIIVPEDVAVANGVVYFSFGSGECEFTGVTVYSVNNCYIETIPNYKKCNGKNTIFFYYTEPKETFNVSVRCFDGWEVDSSNVECIVNDDEVMVITPDDYKDEYKVNIFPNNQCGGNNNVQVILKKKGD